MNRTATRKLLQNCKVLSKQNAFKLRRSDVVSSIFLRVLRQPDTLITAEKAETKREDLTGFTSVIQVSIRGTS